MIKQLLAAVFAVTISCNPVVGEEISSPDSHIVVRTANQGGKISYTVDFKNKPIIAKSPLGLALEGGAFSDGLKVVDSVQSSHDSTWEAVWGEVKTHRNQYNELVLNVEENGSSPKKMQIVFRVFNDGIAFRYVFPKQAGLSKVVFAKEQSAVHFVSRNPVAWYARTPLSVVGPVHIKKDAKSKDKRQSRPATSGTPFTLQLAKDRYISLHEAAVDRSADSRVRLDKKANSITFIGKSTQPTPAISPWRTVNIADSAGGLIESSLALNLNEPNALSDTSWIKPGKSLWDWRNHGGHADDGFEYAMTTESYIRYIDFASKNNIQYVLVDAEWYGPERKKKSDPTTYLPQIDIPAICEYAKSKNIAMWLYINKIALKEYDIDQTFALYRDWGIAGIKHGFLSGSTQEHVEFSHKVMEKCAEYEIMYVLHEPNKPTGMRRTYPHFMSREYINGMLDSANRPASTPTQLCIFPFVHNLAGPLDRSCGMFDLDSYITRERCHRQLPTTVASQVAQCLIFPSGLLTLPDSPDAYNRKPDLFEFIANLPMTYDETRVLNAEIGRLVTLAKRSGSAWFVSSLADEKGRSFELTLDFLEEGVTYDATLYEDGEDADYRYIGPANKKAAKAKGVELVPTKTKRELYQVRKKTVQRGDVIRVRIAPGGGHNLWIRPAATAN